MLMSGVTQGGARGLLGCRIFVDAWKSTSIGLVVFLLSGLLGFILFYASPSPVALSFRNFVPAFIGLLILPSLVMQFTGKSEPVLRLYGFDCIAMRVTLLKGVMGGVVVLAAVIFSTGWFGLLVMLASTGIGLLPILFGTRRMNCLGLILLPAACIMSGSGASVAVWLGLV